jgi:CheY-like chemotaxis protein
MASLTAPVLRGRDGAFVNRPAAELVQPSAIKAGNGLRSRQCAAMIGPMRRSVGLRTRGYKYILMVDDSEADMAMVDEALSRCGIPASLHTVENAVLAFGYLTRNGAFAEAPTPDLVLLDLSMPVLDGRKVLKIIKTEPAWKHIPVFVMTTSKNPKDAEDCYDLGADLFVIKPGTFEQWMRIVRAIGGYLSHRKPVGTTSAVMHVMPAHQRVSAVPLRQERRITGNG